MSSALNSRSAFLAADLVGIPATNINQTSKKIIHHLFLKILNKRVFILNKVTLLVSTQKSKVNKFKIKRILILKTVK